MEQRGKELGSDAQCLQRPGTGLLGRPSEVLANWRAAGEEVTSEVRLDPTETAELREFFELLDRWDREENKHGDESCS